MYKAGDVIDGKFTVTGVCSNSGGMGIILNVNAAPPYPFPVVLKYCCEFDEESLNRFRRETRLLSSYYGISKVAEIVYHNAEHSPPYFVMKFYPGGDLGRYSETIRSSNAYLENAILQMIDAIHELHSRGRYHRDIKPQNFLVDNGQIVVSDFGLSTEIGSDTAFTRKSTIWGSYGYIPPEFSNGGFKNADASSDIYMLGKTIYCIASGSNPSYLIQGKLPAPLFHVITKSCHLDKNQRYQSLNELRQSVVAAFDVILNRGGGVGIVQQLLNSIIDRVETQQTFDPTQFASLVENISLLDDNDKIRICMDIPHSFFSIVGHPLVLPVASNFLQSYETMVKNQTYGWSFAEVIANNMNSIFRFPNCDDEIRGRALDLAISASIYMHRFAAMDTCIEMIYTVRHEPLGGIVAALIHKYAGSFVDNIETMKCQNESIIRAVQANKRL